MWCSVCQSDVATEVGADNRRVSCSNCGHLLGGAAGATPGSAALAHSSSASGPDTRAEEARQLLDRWAKGHFFDPYGPPKKISAEIESGIATRSDASHVEKEPTVVADQRTSMAEDQRSTSPASGDEENRNRETIDERTFLAGSQKLESRPENRIVTNTVQSKTEATDSEPDRETSDKDPATPPKREDRQSVDSGLAAKTSSEELDRLTREIMERVSRITEAREAASVKEAKGRDLSDRHSNESSDFDAEDVESRISPELTASFAMAGRNESPVQDGRSRRAEPAAFDRSAKAKAETSIRTDTTHQSTKTPAAHQVATLTNPVPVSAAPGGWYNNIGQMLAYLGIIFLTAGTCGVIVSYFGGPTHYAPYGWLGATIGQMLLFLGIVTLISAGMEQTSQELRQAVDQRMNEVTQRLDLIGSRIMRIEEANHEGPPRPHLLSRPEQERRRAESATSRATRHND
jgi:hypothetical protein